MYNKLFLDIQFIINKNTPTVEIYIIIYLHK